jgi:dimethylamine monooxygenase subunit A
MIFIARGEGKPTPLRRLAGGWLSGKIARMHSAAPMDMPLLARLRPEDYAFSLRGWKAPASEFFGATPAGESILAERRRWLALEPGRYLLHRPQAAPLIAEAADLAGECAPRLAPLIDATRNDPAQSLRVLGENWEPDILLLRKDAAGRYIFLGGSACFPSEWAPDERLGMPLERQHSPVPGLNDALAHKINTLLDRLPPRYAWLRANWGVTSSPEANQHPSRGLRQHLHPDSPPESLWLRIEHQALLRLPKSEGILFGIRLSVYPMEVVRQERDAAQALARQLRSLPEDMLRYKHITGLAQPLADWLEG